MSIDVKMYDNKLHLGADFDRCKAKDKNRFIAFTSIVFSHD